MVGSYVPFDRARADREKTGDPRLSIEERYRNRQDYVRKVAAAAEELVRERFMIEEDVPRVVERAAARWDSLMSPGAEK